MNVKKIDSTRNFNRTKRFLMCNILLCFLQGSEFSGPKKTDLHERQRLIQLVHLQAQEIDALKEEITLLSRKGGHILPPAQPPLPQISPGPRQ